MKAWLKGGLIGGVIGIIYALIMKWFSPFELISLFIIGFGMGILIWFFIPSSST